MNGKHPRMHTGGWSRGRGQRAVGAGHAEGEKTGRLRKACSRVGGPGVTSSRREDSLRVGTSCHSRTAAVK